MCNTVQEQQCSTVNEEQCTTVNEQVSSLDLVSLAFKASNGGQPNALWRAQILKKTVLPELRIPPSGLQHGQRAAVQHRQRTGDFLISITGVSNWDNSSQQHFISSRNSTNKHFQVCNTVQEQKCETQYMEKYEEQCSTVNEQVHSLYLFSLSLAGFLPETVWTKIILLGVQHFERASVQHCERASMFLLLINHPYFPHRLCP